MAGERRRTPACKAVFALLPALAAGIALCACSMLGAVKVTKITLPEDKIAAGQPFWLGASVENNGLAAAGFDGTLLIDGEVETSASATVEPDEPQSVTLNVHGLEAGKHKAAFGGAELEFTVYKPAELKVRDLQVEPAQVKAGETAKARISVRNTGELEGTYTGALTVDGMTYRSCNVTLSPGDDATVEIDLTLQGRGAHTVGLEGLSRTVTVLAPANVGIAGLSLSADTAKPKEAVTATVTMRNDGDFPGTGAVELSVNGKAVASREASLGANETVELEFDVTQAKAGSYTIKAGDYEETFSVVQIIRPATGTLLVKAANGGYTPLYFHNGCSDLDAIFVLTSKTNATKPLLTVYVRAGQTTKAIKVKNGSYNIYFSTGNDYDAGSKTFMNDTDFGVFDQAVRCNGTSGYNVGISVANGNASTSDVDEGSFPR